MAEALSIPIDDDTRRRLDALAERSRQTRESLAAEALAHYLAVDDWQTAQIEAGLADLDAGREVSHEEASAWLRSWGTESEGEAPG